MRRKPASICVLPQGQLPATNAAEDAMQTHSKSRGIPLHRAQLLPRFNVQSQFLGNLAHQSRRQTLARLHLATGELPAAAVFLRRALSPQHTPLSIQYKSCHHLQCSVLAFHTPASIDQSHDL